MTDESTDEQRLRSMARDPALTPSQRLRALEGLAKIRPAAAPSAAPDAPPDLLAGLADGAFEDSPDVRDLPPDVMRDLDFSAVAGEEMHPLFFAWTTAVPRHLTRRQLLAAQQASLRRAAAAGVTAGPDGAPVGDDELAPRRRRRRG